MRISGRAFLPPTPKLCVEYVQKNSGRLSNLPGGSHFAVSILFI